MKFDRIRCKLSFHGRSRALSALVLMISMVGCVGTPTHMPPSQHPIPGPLSCSPGQEWCTGDCRDTAFFISNDENCGRCGNSCSMSESCIGMSCGCAAGYVSCLGSCVSSTSFMSDNSNCGSCGHSCGIGESSTGGFCHKMPGLQNGGSTGKGGTPPDAMCTNLIPPGATIRCSLALSKLAPFCAAGGSHR